MSRFILGLAAAGVALGLAGPAAGGGDDISKLTTKEQFISHAFDGSLNEKYLAEKAAASGNSEDVRKYAQMLVEDHKSLNDKLLDLAKELKIGVVSGMSKKHKENMAALIQRTGKEFDQKFLEQMVEGHQKSIDLYTRFSKEAKEESVRTFAEKTLPTLRKHLEGAKEIQAKIK